MSTTAMVVLAVAGADVCACVVLGKPASLQVWLVISKADWQVDDIVGDIDHNKDDKWQHWQ